MRSFVAIAIVLVALAINADAATRGLGFRIECLNGRGHFESRIYEGKIKELIENLKVQLREGIPDKNIPVMDPFVLNNLQVKTDFPLAELDWNMTAGQIVGATQFDVTKLSLNLAGFKFTFGVEFPSIAGQGKYGLDGVLGGILPVLGNGDFDVEANGLNIECSGKLGSKNKFLFLENFSISISLEEFDFKVTGLMGDPSLSAIVSEMVSDSLPGLLDDFQKEIDRIVSAKVTEIADKFLANKTINDIISGLKPRAEDYIICGDEDEVLL